MRSPARTAAADHIETAFTDAGFDSEVDMVLGQIGPDRYRAAATTGAVTFRRTTIDEGDVVRHGYEVESVEGVDPLADGAVDRFAGLDAELAHQHPTRDANAYPHAFDQIAQFFDSPLAPDLVVQHTSGHHFGKNIGEHGSLGVVQARAPFIVSGAGVAPAGTLARSARMVDVAPTVMWLLGGDAHPDAVGPTGAARRDALLRRQDGDPLTDLFERGGARHVVLILLDGCNANVLEHAIVTGRAPAIASLAAPGVTLGHGLMASLPTATLANHTTASTGVHPGHSGVLHNVWHDREQLCTPDLLAMDQMFSAMVHLRPDVETIHQAVHRSRPDAFTAALFEFCDTGADVSTFAGFRAGHPPALPQPPDLDGTGEFIESSGAYSFMSSVDELATRQAIALWERTEGNPLPDFTFLSLALTDEAGHEGGPHSEIAMAAIVDGDRRVARLLDAVDRSGARADTAFLVIADHGMEANDPANRRPWAEVREAAGADGPAFVDVADGLLYMAAEA